MLHIITQSLFHNQSAGAGLATLSTEDAVLLLGDGLYGAAHPMLSGRSNIYAIAEDRATRALPPQPGIVYIDYAQMVALTETHHPIVTWS